MTAKLIDRGLLLLLRQSLLAVVDAVERRLELTPRTVEIRRWAKTRHQRPVERGNEGNADD
jgi:hypothetical protein